jgi:hypothetical protein
VRCGTIHATGVLDELSITHYDRQGRTLGPARQFRSPMHLLLASGNISEQAGKLCLNLSLVASRQRDNGIELLGGLCLGAKVVTCEFVVEAFDDVVLRRETDRGTGLGIWTEGFARGPSGATPPATAGGTEAVTHFSEDPSTKTSLAVDTKVSWADAVMASVRAAANGAEEKAEEKVEPEEPYRPVRPGDILNHQQFGRCVVQRIDSEEEFVTVRLRNNRLVRLSIEVLKLHYLGEEEGHQIFSTGSAPRE